MSVLDSLRWHTFSQTHNEAASTEGKSGVPRFDGESARLAFEKLAGDEGPDYLLHSMQTMLQPRSRQEAQEPYQAGAQQGGPLSRQHGESIPGYVLRRKAWYGLMMDLDPELKLRDGIVAEQLLQNAGLMKITGS
jgi:hypothetical protein